MTAFYNEIDPYAAQWLRNLIAAGHIAPGVVDERPIQEIEAYELVEFTQCHFFAGIGIWSHALRRAGWSDDRPIWTGSCPCQPFSNAGQKKGFQDDRHLWPHWKKLIDVCRPAVIVGEQVASALDWVDLVSADMEGSDYAFGANDLCAAGFGGAHIRQRIYFVGIQHPASNGRQQWRTEPSGRGVAERCSNGGLADDDDARPQGRGLRGDGTDQRIIGAPGLVGGMADGDTRRRGRKPLLSGSVIDGETSERDESNSSPKSGGSICGLADAGCTIVQSREQFGNDKSAPGEIEAEAWEFERRRTRDSDSHTASGLADCVECADVGSLARTKLGQLPQSDGERFAELRSTDAPLLGRQAVDWLYCRDGKWRPVEPGTFPLVDETPARVGRLRAYGNGLDAETATEFCGAVREICDEAGI